MTVPFDRLIFRLCHAKCHVAGVKMHICRSRVMNVDHDAYYLLSAITVYNITLY